jgi:L-asparagine transporter-like permease
MGSMDSSRLIGHRWTLLAFLVLILGIIALLNWDKVAVWTGLLGIVNFGFGYYFKTKEMEAKQ